MIGTTRNVRVFAYRRPADLRRGYDGLYALVVAELGRDPLSGDCFLFTGRTRTRCKVLVFDGTGLCIVAKRLSRGRFACLWPETKSDEQSPSLELTMSELGLFIEGCELVGRRMLSPRVVVPTSLDERRAV